MESRRDFSLGKPIGLGLLWLWNVRMGIPWREVHRASARMKTNGTLRWLSAKTVGASPLLLFVKRPPLKEGNGVPGALTWGTVLWQETKSRYKAVTNTKKRIVEYGARHIKGAQNSKRSKTVKQCFLLLKKKKTLLRFLSRLIFKYLPTWEVLQKHVN